MLSYCAVLTVALAAPVAAQAPLPDEVPIRDEEAVVVTGVQPGPGMWKVSKDGHVMWVLGTLSPLPRRMEWQSRDVEAVIAHAQEVIWAPSLSVEADVGFFRALTLAPKALGARKNPDGALLRDVLPAPLYARWEPLKRRYLGRDQGVEKWRPLFAAMELYGEAIEDAGLRSGGVVEPVVATAAKARKLKQTSPKVRIVIKDVKAALDEFRGAKLDDLDCFDKTLQRLETDMAPMRQRANAWAVGDLEALGRLPYADHTTACVLASVETGAIRKRAPGDIEAEMRTKWLEAAEKALAANGTTFALLPIREAVKPDGYLAALRARGYTVEAPE
jgi:hypothetical protein